MPLTFSFEMFGEQQIQRTLLGIKTRSRDLRQPFQAIRRDFIRIEKDVFRTQGASGPGAWEPLKPATILAKGRKGHTSRGILRDDDDLFRSLTVMSDPNNSYRATRNTMEIETLDPKAIHHQKGAPRANVPQRKVVDLTERDRQGFIKIIQAWVMSKEGASARDSL